MASSLLTGLSSYWKCDESSGNLADSVGGITLVNNGSTPFGPGKINNGIDFGTTNTSKFFNYSSTNIYNGGAFTASMWVKVRTAPTSGQNQIYFISIDSVTDTYPLIMYRNNGGTLQTYMGRSRFGVADDVVISNQNLGTSEFSLLTVTYDGTTVTSYVNGVSVGTIASTGNGSGATTQTRVGSWATGGDWALAYVDEIGFWNRALSGDEVLELFRGGSGNSYPFTTPTGIYADNISSVFNGSTSSITVPHNCSVGATALIVGIRTYNQTKLVTGTPTYAGVPMTLLAGPILGGASDRNLYFYYILNPTPGTNNISVSCTSGSNITVLGASYFGVKTVGFPDSSAVKNITTATSGFISTTVIENNCWLVSVFENDVNAMSAGVGTFIRSVNASSNSFVIGDSNAIVPTGSQSLNFTWGGFSGNYAGIIISMAPFVIQTQGNFFEFM